MAKKLFLTRHAKSDWSVQGQKDFDRDLNSRGRVDAPRMGKKLDEMGVKPDLIISSPALRAKLTTEFIAEQLRYNDGNIQFNEEVYEASLRTLLSIINNIEDVHNQ